MNLNNMLPVRPTHWESFGRTMVIGLSVFIILLLIYFLVKWIKKKRKKVKIE